MRMRRIGLAVVLAVSVFVAPTAVHAQVPAKVWRIGILQTSSTKDEVRRVTALEQGLAELGYVSGRNIVLINRNAGQQVGQLPQFATELVRAGVDVIVTSTNPATLAAKRATSTIPSVMTVGVEPVTAGLVASLAKPGANVTGLTFDVDATQLAAKRLEILKELMPSVSRVAVLWNPGYAPGSLRLKGTEQAGHSLGVTIVSVHFTEGGDAERAFTEIRRAKAEAVTVLSDPVLVARRLDITEMAARYRVPAIYALREWVDDGGLMSYATSLNEQWRLAARYVDKILKGAKCSDLPLEQPSKFELLINMKTAKALGLTIPQTLILQATEVIE